MILLGCGCTLQSDAYILNHQMAVPSVHAVEVVGVTSCAGFPNVFVSLTCKTDVLLYE